MPAVIDLKEQLNELVTFKFISQAFTEASAVKLKNIRVSFEKNAKFYDEISHVFHLITASAKALNLQKKTTGKEKTLSVALTSNLRFYGILNIEIIRKYLYETEKMETNLLVIGGTGIDYLNSIGYKGIYEKLLFDKDNPSNEEVENFLNSISKYEKVFLYYPKFISFLSQSVGIIDITQKETTEKVDDKEEVQIIFEPELDKILSFFETQVRLLLFRRVLLEVELARTAARLLTMSQAEERADTEVKLKKMEIRKLIRSIQNAQLLETFAGMSQWGK